MLESTATTTDEATPRRTRKTARRSHETQDDAESVYAGMTREQGLAEFCRLEPKAQEWVGFIRDKREMARRDLPCALFLGGHFTLIRHFNLHRTAEKGPYKTVVEMARAQYHTGHTQFYNFCNLHQGIPQEWMENYNRPSGIDSALEVVKVPLFVRKPLFDLICEGVKHPKILAGRLSAQDAIFLGLGEDEVVDWAVRGARGLSTEGEKRVREQRQKIRMPREKPGEPEFVGLPKSLSTFERQLVVVTRSVGLVVVAAKAGLEEADDEAVSRVVSRARGTIAALGLAVETLESLSSEPAKPADPLPGREGSEARRHIKREEEDRRGAKPAPAPAPEPGPAARPAPAAAATGPSAAGTTPATATTAAAPTTAAPTTAAPTTAAPTTATTENDAGSTPAVESAANISVSAVTTTAANTESAAAAPTAAASETTEIPPAETSAPAAATTEIPPAETSATANGTTEIPPAETSAAATTTEIPPAETSAAATTTEIPPAETSAPANGTTEIPPAETSAAAAATKMGRSWCAWR